MVVVSYLVKIVMPFKPLPPDLTRQETAKYRVGLDLLYYIPAWSLHDLTRGARGRIRIPLQSLSTYVPWWLEH